MLNLHIKQKVISQDIHSGAKVRCWMLEARCWILDLRIEVQRNQY